MLEQHVRVIKRVVQTAKVSLTIEDERWDVKTSTQRSEGGTHENCIHQLKEGIFHLLQFSFGEIDLDVRKSQGQ